MILGKWHNGSNGTIVGKDVHVHGSSGSSWTTREVRNQKGWPDAGEPENIFLLDPAEPRSFEATIKAMPRKHGEQAGLYMHANAESWVKFVLEGDGSGGVSLVLAEQSCASPFLRGKLSLPDFQGSVTLRLGRGEGGQAEAWWKSVFEEEWRPMTRGSGWLEPSELDGKLYGCLEDEDPRGNTTALCKISPDSRAALVTEQWQDDPAEVSFLNVSHT
ncbi:unnamed protein product [Polarella glacialis]|uniref:Uncharacterized protein n=1 Tax=Polarella glacialis TaxID=89957 RepID=A0A813L6A5_POLGL|nr:unnamed protein product [Polarella glacialis]CAE8623155.1 unnamed protein product [Polarella glacialis]CAE8720525.1 unnamed protein product [Polarella glacialis]